MIIKKKNYINYTTKNAIFIGSLYKIKQRDDSKSYHAHPYGIPHAHKQKFKQEVQWLCELGMLRKINRS